MTIFMGKRISTVSEKIQKKMYNVEYPQYTKSIQCTCGENYSINRTISNFCPYCGCEIRTCIQSVIEQNQKLKFEFEKKSREAIEQFKHDLYEDSGVENNPKRDLLFSKAWELGHSSGFTEVVCYFNDLVDLIK